ncbi:MAG TPA: diguanylate cyclase [Phycisphaerae bacterium]|nr:diguanylate cyclase [Phycisphaerae bacterium]
MTLDLILPWFPIILAVGVGSRLLNQVRGTGFGLLGAVFWLALVLATNDSSALTENWPLVSLLAGSAAIVAVGTWSGSEPGGLESGREHGGPASSMPTRPLKRHAVMADALRRYDGWLEANRHSLDPWPEFGEFLRSVLFDLCGATHVYPYRILSEGDRLVPLRAVEPGDLPDVVSARRGIVGHVSTSGVSYIAGDAAHGELVDHLAEECGEQIAWCFAIQRGPGKIGLVKVGELDKSAQRDPVFLELVGRLIGQFWTTLGDVCRSRTAELRDPASGLHTREPFLVEADRTLAEAYAHGEPVVLTVLTIEGMRALTDSGDWQLADALVAEVSHLLQERVRAEDRLGRFDDSRFVLLLRRVDSALGTLIVEQLLGRLVNLCVDPRWAMVRGTIKARCGVAGSGTEQPTLSELIIRATAQCDEARRLGRPLCSDLHTAETCGVL